MQPSGFYWDLELFAPDGTLLERERVHNLTPTEGLNLTAGILFNGVAPPAAWYIGLFESNYTPVAGVTAATLAGVLTESTAYDEATRQQFVAGSAVAGYVDNAASPANFTFNAAKTIYGGFIVSNSAKLGATGTLISIAQFASPKSVDAGTVLRITTGYQANAA